MYKDEIIHFTGGMVTYIGRLDQSEHPNGEGWYRILDPCTMTVYEDDKRHAQLSLQRIWGMSKFFRHFVDIYCPPDSLKEIRVLDKNGGLYKAYMKELGQPEMELIVSPSEADIKNIDAGKAH